ncbi:MAG TPA: hypothetical protein VH559_07750 [Gemmatimonadaceae bacterium]
MATNATFVPGGTVERWNGGTVERWSGGTVERWNGGTHLLTE